MANGNNNTIITTVFTAVVVAGAAFIGTQVVEAMDQTKTNKENITSLIESQETIIQRYEMELKLHEAREHVNHNPNNQLGNDQQGNTEGNHEVAERIGQE
jgi:hypothetical protein